ncbi:hypothetical protein CSX11_06530 [Mycobacterium goodii]|nr:hypothetical protein CSX11_06530 [Mycolicibacterium goodii]
MMAPNTPFSSSDDDWGDSSAFDNAYADDATSDLSVFDVHSPAGDEPDAGFDALDEYVAAESFDDDAGHLDAVATPPAQESDEDDPGPLFSATNPPGTITVTAYLSGWLQRIDLAPSVVNMAESQLAREVAELAEIATKKAAAGRYVFLLYATVREIGDSPDVRDMLKETLGLPTPEEAAEAEAAYARRYARDGH